MLMSMEDTNAIFIRKIRKNNELKVGQGFENKPSTEQAKLKTFFTKTDGIYDLTWLHVHIFHDNSTGVKEQKNKV